MGNYPENITRDKPSNFQAVQEFFAGRRKENELTENQEEYLLRIRACYGMLLKFKSKKYILKALAEQFSISERQVWRLINETERLFGDLAQVNKDFERHMAMEMAKEAYNRAKKRNDVKSMVSATAAYIKASGIEHNDPELPDFQKLEPSLIVTVLPEGMEDDIKGLLRSGALNFNKLPAETIPYEEVTGRTDQGGDSAAAQSRE